MMEPQDTLMVARGTDSIAKLNDSPPGDLLDASTKRRIIAARLLEVEMEAQRLKESYNALSPACCLPPEILSRIFFLLPSNRGIFSLYRKPNARKYLPCIIPSQVCHYWRTIIVNCAAFWTDLSTLEDPWFGIALERSQSGPLTIELEEGIIQYPKGLYTALSQSHRLRSVTLRASDKSGLRYPLHGLGFPNHTPVLKTLRLICSSKDSTHYQHYDPSPSTLLAGGAPSLERLTCIRTGIPWHKLPISRSLIHINIEELPSFSGHEQCSLLSLLSSVPLLATLDLSHVLPPTGSTQLFDNPVASPSVTLSRLWSISLEDVAERVANAIQVIKIPRPARIKLTLTDEDVAPVIGQAVRVVSMLRRALSYGDREIQRIFLHAVSSDAYEEDVDGPYDVHFGFVGAGDECNESPYPGWGTDFEWDLHFHARRGSDIPRVSSEILSAFNHSFNLATSLSRLVCITGDFGLDLPESIALHHQTPLETLVLENVAPTHMTRLLDAFSDANLAPSLNRLSLTALSNLVFTEGGGWIHYDAPLFAQALLRLARARPNLNLYIDGSDLITAESSVEEVMEFLKSAGW